MNTQQPPKTSKFYFRSKKCDIENTLGDGYQPPFGSPKVNLSDILYVRNWTFSFRPISKLFKTNVVTTHAFIVSIDELIWTPVDLENSDRFRPTGIHKGEPAGSDEQRG